MITKPDIIQLAKNEYPIVDEEKFDEAIMNCNYDYHVQEQDLARQHFLTGFNACTELITKSFEAGKSAQEILDDLNIKI